MVRVEQLAEALEKQNVSGGLDKDQWVIWLLGDIALSLATISDTLSRMESGGEQDG